MMRRALVLSPIFLALACGGGGSASDFKELSADVTVVRDRMGVPHVYGKTREDVAYAAGYEHARDRLFQMDLLRRMAQGRMAELLGERWNGTNYFDQDFLLRAVGFYRSAEETVAWMKNNDKDTYQLMSAYAAGVSSFIAEAKAGTGGIRLPYGFGASELGYEPDSWKPADSAAIGKLQTWALSSSVSYELLSTLIQYVLDETTMKELVTYAPPEEIFVLDGFPAAGGAFASVAQSAQAVTEGDPLTALFEARATPRAFVSPATRAARARLLDPEALRAVADKVFAAVRALSPLGMDAGSNNWVVSGAHTATGKPILCNDPHLPLSSPPNFYFIHLNTADQGGDLDVAGVSFPGAPVVVLGHNRRIAWGATVARGDVADVFAETLSADRKRSVHDSGEEALVEWKEKIRVRNAGAPLQQFEEREVTLQVVPRHGPVLPAEATLPPALAGADLLSFAWTGNGPTNEIGAFARLNRAVNVKGFKEALEQVSVGAQNFIYADSDGHVAYYAHARYPLRKTLDPENPPWFAVPGSGAYDWTKSDVPKDRVPQALNPAKGYVATANNDPVGLTRGGDPLSGPFYLGPLYDPGYRAWRITTELERLIARGRADPNAKITTLDMKELQLDDYSRLAARLLPHLASAASAARAGRADLATYAQSAALLAAADRLAAWDKKTSAASPDAALFHLWIAYFGAGTLRDEIGGTIFDRAVEASLDVMMRPLLFIAEKPATPPGHDYFDDVRTTSVVENREGVALASLDQALRHGARVFQSADVATWRWDRIHTVTFTNTYGQMMDVGPVGIAGGVGTVNVADPALIAKDSDGAPPDVLKTVHGPNLRMVVTFDSAGRPNAEVILPGGQSGVPGNTHFGDQVADWAAGRYRKLLFSRAEIDAAMESVTVFNKGRK